MNNTHIDKVMGLGHVVVGLLVCNDFGELCERCEKCKNFTFSKVAFNTSIIQSRIQYKYLLHRFCNFNLPTTKSPFA